MVADYAADFTRLGLLPVLAPSTLCARQAKKPLYACGGGGEKGWVMIPANRHVYAELQIGFPFPFEIRDPDRHC